MIEISDEQKDYIQKSVNARGEMLTWEAIRHRGEWANYDKDELLHYVLSIDRESPVYARETENVLLHTETQKDATTPIYEAIAGDLQGIEALKHYLDNGIKLIGTYESGAAIASGNGYKAAFTSCLADIKALREGKGDKEGRAKGKPINRFRFIPKDNSFLIIDIDRGHADGIDGLELFYRFFEIVGKTRETMPSTMNNIEGGSFPCYVSTPSGGFHLYFKYSGAARLKQNLDSKGIDILYTKAATAAGSAKENGAYILHGNLDEAPQLYSFIEKRIIQPPPAPIQTNQYRNNKKYEGDTTWDKIIMFVAQDGYGTGGRNERAFSLAFKAATHNWTLSNTISALMSEPSLDGLSQSEIETAAQSAYRRTEKAA